MSAEPAGELTVKRIYHHYTAWEEFKAGMWRVEKKPHSDAYLKEAIDFTGDHELYGEYMRRVISEWPISCEHNLTDKAMNRQAWIGHAACTLAIGCPEYITRLAWAHLSYEQQDLANAQADAAICAWEQKHAQKNR